MGEIFGKIEMTKNRHISGVRFHRRAPIATNRSNDRRLLMEIFPVENGSFDEVLLSVQNEGERGYFEGISEKTRVDGGC